MSYQFYKILHFIGIFMVFSGLGGQLLHAMNRGAKQHPARKWLAIMHGVGLLFIFVAGFGLIARLGVGFPGWVWAKIVIWMLLGGIGAIAARKQAFANGIWILTIAVGGLAAFLALYKPF